MYFDCLKKRAVALHGTTQVLRDAGVRECNPTPGDTAAQSRRNNIEGQGEKGGKVRS